jgi:single-stranded DNA-binding protein
VSLHALASGVLTADPVRRTGPRGDFATAPIRIGSGDAVQWVSVIAFGELSERLLSLRGADALSIAGRLELRTWRGNDGAERAGLTIVASEVAAARPRRGNQRRQSAYRRSTAFASGSGTAPPLNPT